MKQLCLRRHLIIDALAIAWGVTIVCLLTYAFDIEPEIVQMVCDDFDTDDYILVAFVLSISLAGLSLGAGLRPALDPGFQLLRAWCGKTVGRCWRTARQP